VLEFVPQSLVDFGFRTVGGCYHRKAANRSQQQKKRQQGRVDRFQSVYAGRSMQPPAYQKAIDAAL